MPTPGFPAGLGALSEADAVVLVEKVRGGDADAWGQLYEHGRRQVERYLSRRMVDQTDVEDVVHDTFLRVPDVAHEFNPATHEVGAWLCGRVANHTLTDYGRKERFRRLSAIEAAQLAAMEAEHVGPAAPAYERESRPLSPRMLHALAQLTPAQRQSVQLRYLDELTTAQAAEVAGSSAAAIATNANAARKRLRSDLADLAPRSDSWLDGMTKKDAVNIALANSRGDVPAAREWLRTHGVTVDNSYVYAIRNGRRGTSALGDGRRHNGRHRAAARDNAVAESPSPAIAADEPPAAGTPDQSVTDYAALRLAFGGGGGRRQDRARETACRYATEHGQWPTTSQLATLAEVSNGTAGNALKDLRARTPTVSEQAADAPLAGANAPPVAEPDPAAPPPTAEPDRTPGATAEHDVAQAGPIGRVTDQAAEAALAASLRRTDEALRAAATAVRQIRVAAVDVEQADAERERERQIARWQEDDRAAETTRAAETDWEIAS